MKRTFLILIILALSINIFAQRVPYGLWAGKTGSIGGQITLYGLTSGTVQIKVPAAAGTGTIFQVPGNNGSNGYVLTTNGSGVLAWSAPGAATMVYPSDGIALASGGAWGTSITNNSTNWNTAYDDRLKWDGGSTGLTAATGRTSLGGTTAGQSLFTLSNPSAITFLRVNADNTVTALSAANFKTALSLTATDISLGNVTNESKATMFTSPTLTGTAVLPSTTSIGNVTSTELGYLDNVTSAIQTQIGNKADKYLTDTLSLTSATYTLVLADAGRTIYCSHATYQEILIPTNTNVTFPIGTVITFVKAGAGPVRINPDATVVRKSVLDSTTMNTTNAWYQLVKRATNKWYYVGNWTD